MVGSRIKEHRLAAGYTLRGLARQAGMEPAQLSRIERSGNPTIKTIDRLARALNLPISELLAPPETAEPTEVLPLAASLAVEPEAAPVSLSSR